MEATCRLDVKCPGQVCDHLNPEERGRGLSERTPRLTAFQNCTDGRKDRVVVFFPPIQGDGCSRFKEVMVATFLARSWSLLKPNKSCFMVVGPSSRETQDLNLCRTEI